MDIKKILFIVLSCVADVVMTLAVIQTLQQKFPRAIFGFVADRRSSNIDVNLAIREILHE